MDRREEAPCALEIQHLIQRRATRPGRASSTHSTAASSIQATRPISVEKAKSLVEEAIDRMMNELKRDAGSGDDTEQLRLTLKRYRDMLYTLGERMR